MRSPATWRGYAEVARVAAELNRLVVDALWAAGVPALRIQPSASARCRDGELLALDDRPLIAALEHGLAPVVHGDVALDDVRGGTIISTEEIFGWLAPRLRPQRVVLVGEVAGVLTADPSSGVEGEVISTITPTTLPLFAETLGGSRGRRHRRDGGQSQPNGRPGSLHTVVGLRPGDLRAGAGPRAFGSGRSGGACRHAHRGRLN